jgi:hypothetical protein
LLLFLPVLRVFFLSLLLLLASKTYPYIYERYYPLVRSMKRKCCSKIRVNVVLVDRKEEEHFVPVDLTNHKFCKYQYQHCFYHQYLLHDGVQGFGNAYQILVILYRDVYVNKRRAISYYKINFGK